MKIGILGGTFDPIHLGHLELARSARSQFSLDKVIFIPACVPPHKQTATLCASPEDRYEMTRLAIEDDPFFEISDCEIKRQGVSYTWETLEELEKKYPQAVFYLILGEDAFKGLDAWNKAGEIKRKVRFLVAEREVAGGKAPEDVRAERIRMEPCPISATGIRESFAQGGKLDVCIPQPVLNYIQARRLYRKDPS